MRWTVYADPGPPRGAPAGEEEDEGEEATVLAAVLIPGLPGGALDAALDRALRAATAPLPWPVAPGDLESPLGLAVALDPVPRAAVGEELAAALAAAAPWVRGLAEGAASAWALDRRLAEDEPAAWRALRATQLLVHRRVRRALAGLLSARGPRGDGPRPWVFVARGAGGEETGQADALYALLEAVAALQVEADAPPLVVHCVLVEPAPRGPAERLWSTTALRSLAATVPGSPLLARCLAAQAARFPIHRAPVGGPGAPGGAVLARWLRGEAAGLLAGAPEWAELVVLSDARLARGALGGVAPRLAPGRSLPTVRALGRACRRLRVDGEGPVASVRDLAPPPWAPEATRPWLDAAAAGLWT